MLKPYCGYEYTQALYDYIGQSKALKSILIGWKAVGKMYRASWLDKNTITHN